MAKHDCRLRRYGHRVPKWACLKEMRRLYNLAESMGYSIDHVVPISSNDENALVCGLHWEGNFKIMHPNPNIKKSDKTWPGQWLEQSEMFTIHNEQLELNL